MFVCEGLLTTLLRLLLDDTDVIDGVDMAIVELVAHINGPLLQKLHYDMNQALFKNQNKQCYCYSTMAITETETTTINNNPYQLPAVPSYTALQFEKQLLLAMEANCL